MYHVWLWPSAHAYSDRQFPKQDRIWHQWEKEKWQGCSQSVLSANPSPKRSITSLRIHKCSWRIKSGNCAHNSCVLVPWAQYICNVKNLRSWIHLYSSQISSDEANYITGIIIQPWRDCWSGFMTKLDEKFSGKACNFQFWPQMMCILNFWKALCGI